MKIAPLSIPSDLPAWLRRCSQAFFSVKRYAAADQIITKALHVFPRNREFPPVLAKTVLINALYATAVLDVVRLAEHIVRQDLDPFFKGGDIRAVDSIRTGHGIVNRKTGADRNLYSFATKYAHWHTPHAYPIFDALVSKLLLNLCHSLPGLPKLDHHALAQYERFKEVVNQVKDAAGVSRMGYKEFDQALWVWAKFLRGGKDLPAAVVEDLRRIHIPVRRGLSRSGG